MSDGTDFRFRDETFTLGNGSTLSATTVTDAEGRERVYLELVVNDTARFDGAEMHVLD